MRSVSPARRGWGPSRPTGLQFVIQVQAVGTGVLNDVGAILKCNACVVRGNVAVGVRQHPLVVAGPADPGAFLINEHAGRLAERGALLTDNGQAQRHRTVPRQKGC